MRRSFVHLLRAGHILWFQKELPEHVAIYFHELEDHQTARFAEAVQFFLEHGYRVVDAAGLLDAKPGERRLFISFDDNFRSWRRAAPLMERLGVTCTFYVNSGVFSDMATPDALDAYFGRIRFAGERETLSRSELIELAGAGHTIGCHTHTHPMLSRLPRAHWSDEIESSKRQLEDLVQGPVLDFSFPFGMRRHFSRKLRQYCVAAGFRSIATGLSGLQHVAPRDPLALHRTGWKFSRSLKDNITDLRINARLYAGLTGRSALG